MIDRDRSLTRWCAAAAALACCLTSCATARRFGEGYYLSGDAPAAPPADAVTVRARPDATPVAGAIEAAVAAALREHGYRVAEPPASVRVDCEIVFHGGARRSPAAVGSRNPFSAYGAVRERWQRIGWPERALFLRLEFVDAAAARAGKTDLVVWSEPLPMAEGVPKGPVRPTLGADGLAPTASVLEPALLRGLRSALDRLLP
ncbi:MAG: hypothetical protein AAF628_29155 [Planctomycetota bacterium]